MITVPAGQITLRDDRKKTVWTVEVQSFLLAPVPVTEQLYFSVLQRDVTPPDRAQLPVVNVSWKDAVSFCNVLSQHYGLDPCYTFTDTDEEIAWDPEANGFRLPTEAEWQYACQAGTAGYRYGELEEVAWYSENSRGMAHEVGKKRPNGWGLYDMLGNVWEWCWDIYDKEVYGSYRVFRGGGWAEEERGCGATVRRRSHPTFHIDDLGFRLARSI